MPLSPLITPLSLHESRPSPATNTETFSWICVLGTAEAGLFYICSHPNPQLSPFKPLSQYCQSHNAFSMSSRESLRPPALPLAPHTVAGVRRTDRTSGSAVAALQPPHTREPDGLSPGPPFSAHVAQSQHTRGSGGGGSVPVRSGQIRRLGPAGSVRNVVSTYGHP